MSASPTRHDEGGQTTHAYGPIDDLDLKCDGRPGPGPLAVRRYGGRGDP